MTGQIALCYGPPKCGTSLICQTLKGASNTAIEIIEYPCPLSKVESLLDSVEWLLVDVVNGLLSGLDVQAFVDRRLLSASMGVLCRFDCDNDTCLFRAEEGDLELQDLLTWRDELLKINEKCKIHSLKTCGIPTFDLENAVISLATRLKLRK